jgi:O-Glycosyl hydrolase
MKSVYHIKSIENNCWQEAPVGAAESKDTLELTGAVRGEMKGFGGCFNEMAWQALLELNKADRDAYMKELFSEEGCNFNFGRVPIGANDFSMEWYSCDEVKDDYELKHFNIDRDKEMTIPFIKEAMKYKDDFFVFGSPWSPPTWMKTKAVYNYGTLRMEDAVLKAYARYFVKFVQSYKAEGVNVKQVHIQNEPMADQKFPSCLWTGEEMLLFIRDYIGPAFEEAGLDAEVWLGTINGPFVDMMLGMTPFGEFFDQFINTVLSDEKARNYISGVGLQWGGKHVLEQTAASYPEVRIMQTESECGDGVNSWEHMEYIFGIMWQYFRHGAERYTYWNFALPKGGESAWGWKQNSLAIVDTEAKTLILNPEFYLMKHFSHFVKSGAKILDVKGHWSANTMVFENPDGQLVLVVGSNMHRERIFSFVHGEKSFSAVIEPHSVHTFVI